MTRRSWITLIAVGTAVIVGAVLAITLPGGKSGLSPTDDLAADERDAVWACSVIDNLPDPLEKSNLGIEEPALYRAIAAGALAAAASLASNEWADFDDPGNTLVSAGYKLDFEQIDDSSAELRELCKDVQTLPYKSDSALMCEIIGAAPEDVEDRIKDDAVESPFLWEFMGASSLGIAAGYGDAPPPSDVSDSAHDLQQAMSTLDWQLLTDSLSNLREFCADLK